MVLFLAPAIDTTLLERHIPWADTAYSVLDGMISRGNLTAKARKSELQQLESILNQIPLSFANQPVASGSNSARLHPQQRTNEPFSMGSTDGAASQAHTYQMDAANVAMQEPTWKHGLTADQLPTQASNEPMDLSTWNYGFTADQLLMVADSLDIDGVDWLMTGSSHPSN